MIGLLPFYTKTPNDKILLRLAGIAPAQARRCRIHALRHTFATRSLEQCSTRRDAPEDVRAFQLHLTSSGAGISTISTTISALRFFFKVTLDRPDLGRHLSTIHRPRKAPVVLSPDEVARFLGGVTGHQIQGGVQCRLWRGTARLRVPH
jgi:site-specific recombinase XerD